MTMLTMHQREELLRYASRLTSAPEDEHMVVDVARALEAWVVAGDRLLGGTKGAQDDVRLRMAALDRLYTNLMRLAAMPKDDVEEFTGKAACLYVFLGGNPDLLDEAPVRVSVIAGEVTA